LNAQEANNVIQTEIFPAVPIVFEPSACEIELAIEN
jgi:hypothetical protein